MDSFRITRPTIASLFPRLRVFPPYPDVASFCKKKKVMPRMCVCARVLMCRRACSCTNGLDAHLHVYNYVFIYACMHVCRVCVCVCLCVCACVCVCVCVYHTHTHTDADTHTHTHTHTHTPGSWRSRTRNTFTKCSSWPSHAPTSTCASWKTLRRKPMFRASRSCPPPPSFCLVRVLEDFCDGSQCSWAQGHHPPTPSFPPFPPLMLRASIPCLRALLPGRPHLRG
jgi:hypothetical protein